MSLFKLGLLYSFISLIFPIVSRAEFLNGGWSLTSSLPIATANHKSTIFNTNIYLFGGSASNAIPNRLFTNKLPSGELNTWGNLNSVNNVYYWQAIASRDNFFYLIGGQSWPSSVSNNEVYLGYFESNGQVNGWNLLNTIPKILSKSEAVIIGDWLYVAGGFSSYGNITGTLNNQVYKAKIGVDGSLGSWDVAGTMPNGLCCFGLVAKSNKLIFMGGWKPGGDGTVDVYSATVDPISGNLSNWDQSLPDLPEGMRSFAYVQTDEGVMTLGGYSNNAGWLNSVYFAEFDNSGNTKNWVKSNYSLPKKTVDATAVKVGEYIYFIGGHAGDYTTNVLKTKYIPPPKPTPTKTPLILIPGMGASFNTVLLHLGTATPNENWYLASFVKNYDWLINKIKSDGYTLGGNFHIYNYDWRRPINDNALDLKNFIDGKGYSKVDVIGHSMGGLMGARFGASNPSKLNSLKTMGSPFGGSAKVYDIFEGGDLSDFLGFEKIAISSFLETNAGRFDSDAQTVQRNIPSFINVFPVSDFLKKANGQMIPNSKMMWQNNFWPYLQPDVGTILDKTTNVFGTELDTKKYITIKNRNIIDLVLGRYADGRPISTENGFGDETVLDEAARLDGTEWKPEYRISHGNLPSIPSAYPTFDNAVVMFMASPATFEVRDPNGATLLPEDNLLAIDNPVTGNYEVKITPTWSGKYRFYFGRFAPNDLAWDDFSGDTSTGTEALTFYIDLLSDDLGANPIQRALNRLETIKQALETANINDGEKQVFSVMARNLGADLVNLANLDENRLASLHRTALQKVNQVETAWNYPDPEFAKLVVYNLRMLSRDVLEAVGNL